MIVDTTPKPACVAVAVRDVWRLIVRPRAWRTAREFLAKRTDDTELRKIPLEEITSKDVSIAAEHGDQLARDVYKFTGELLGRSCANFTAFCSPEAYVFSVG